MILLKKWCRQILLGIEYLHRWRIIHRDIKGENIFLSTQTREKCVMKIGDLDDIKALKNESSMANNDLTSYKGTLPYSSAEILSELMKEKSEFHVGRKTDIWSYGCVVVEMWTRRPPSYAGDTSGSGQPSPNISTRGQPLMPGDMPEELRQFTDLCLQIDPNHRPDASKLLKDSFFDGVEPILH